MFEIINHKLFKMKKLLLLTISIFCANLISAQNMTYSVHEFKIKDKGESELIKQLDNFFKDATYLKNSGINIEKIGTGWGETSRGMTHRLVFFREIGSNGPINQSSTKEQRNLNWSKVRLLVDQWGPSFHGRMLSWIQGEMNDYPNVQIFHFKADSPEQFKMAHDKFFNSTGNYFNGKSLGFGTIDIGSPDGATHWVAIGSKNTQDLIKMHHDIANKFSKQYTEWQKNNGGIEMIDDFVIKIRRSFK